MWNALWGRSLERESALRHQNWLEQILKDSGVAGDRIIHEVSEKMSHNIAECVCPKMRDLKFVSEDSYGGGIDSKKRLVFLYIFLFCI